MKKSIFRCIAVVMIVLMTAVCAPVSEISDLFDVEASALVTSDVSLGGNVKWKYDSKNEVITVYGSGNMKNFNNGDDGQRWDEIYKGTGKKPINRATKIVIENGVTSIGNNVFNGLKNIKTVVIPASVTNIGASAFRNCTALTSVNIPASVTNISTYAFAGCTSLKSVSVPGSVATIGVSAFEGCSALSSVTLAEGVKTIGAYAFRNTKATRIAIPESATNLDPKAFSGISGFRIICDYGSFLYNYCITNNVACSLPENILVADVVYNDDNTVKVVLKMVYNQAKLNAANFTLNYSYASAVEKNPVVLENNGVVTAIVHNSTGKYSIAVMAPDYVPYSSNADICVFDVAELTFKLNCKYNKTAFTFSADTLLMNDAKTAIAPVTATAKISHTYQTITTKATLDENGSVKKVCSVCGYVSSNKTVYKPESFALSTTTYTYSGSAKAPGVTVTDSQGNVLVKGTDYTVKYASAKTNVGEYPVTITFKGKYSGTKTLYYTIKPDASAKTITLSATKYTYNGKAKAPGVTVTDAKGKTLVKGTDYTVTYSAGKTNIGKYAATVTFMGNYSGTQNAYFLILPGKTTSLTAESTATTIKPTWNKVDGATGYKAEVINASGKVVKTVHTRNNYYTFSGLTTGTTYTVKVTAYKTIKNVNEYSIVSASVSATTKPSTPTFEVSSTTKGKANFKWSNVNGETGYQVYSATSANGSYSKVGTYAADSTSGAKSSLTSGKTYYFKVRAYKKVGDTVIYGGWSAVQSVKIK